MIEDDIKRSRQSTAPAVLLPYQQKWAADKSPVKVMEKSRRIGLSWTEAADDALYAASDSGDDVWYIGYNKDMAEEFIGDCAFWAKQYQLAAGEMEEEIFKDEDKDILSFRIRFSSGHKITALSSRPSNLRGKQGRVVIDEAAFHDGLDELLKAAIALLMWGGEVRVISTHDGDANQFNELVNDIRAGKKPYSLHRVTLDDALAQGLYQRICLKLGRKWSVEAEAGWRQSLVDFYGDAADEELFCVPSQGTGAYLTRALIETCLSPELPVLRYEQTQAFAELPDHIRHAEVNDWCDEHLAPLLAQLDPDRDHYFGEDFGRSGDLTGIMPLTENQNATFSCPFIVELRNVPFKQQEQVLFYIVDRLPRFRFGALDARGNGQYLAEVAMQKYGPHRIAQVMLSEAWYRENMPQFKAAFEDRSILLPKDADVIADLRAFRVIKGIGRLPATKNKGKDNKQRHGDLGIAGALAWYATRQEGGPVAYASAEPEEHHRGQMMSPARRPGEEDSQDSSTRLIQRGQASRMFRNIRGHT
ncbi:MAG: terminase family protein [Thermodesulfobacteriota bacterium]